MASWDQSPTNIAMPAADFSALGAIGDDYRKRQDERQRQELQRQLFLQQQQRMQQGQPQQGQVGPNGPVLAQGAIPVNPATGQPNYAASAGGFLQGGNYPGLASGLTAFGNTVGNFLMPSGIGNPT
jgi:hypothetical protein